MTEVSEPLHQAIISGGSNIDPHEHLRQARVILAMETRLLASADVIQTAPVGFQYQPDFLNTAYLVETPMDRESFNRYLKSVEDRLGRVRGAIKSGPRTIDLDLIAWDGELLTADYYQYDYVSVPVNQIVQNTGALLHSSGDHS